MKILQWCHMIRACEITTNSIVCSTASSGWKVTPNAQHYWPSPSRASGHPCTMYLLHKGPVILCVARLDVIMNMNCFSRPCVHHILVSPAFERPMKKVVVVLSSLPWRVISRIRLSNIVCSLFTQVLNNSFHMTLTLTPRLERMTTFEQHFNTFEQ